MVTDEDRDYVCRVYTHDPHARINLGIRRRLAPLLGNDRKRIELMNCLLFSMPGTPVLYYGDEIGMGDNFFLGDRNGVRTPMQWNTDRNAGFSRANPHKLYLPVSIDPEYHYEAVNVENQQNNTHSLLWWMKRLTSLRKRYKVFGRGTLELLAPENRKALAFVRRYRDECVLVVANLSRFAQDAMDPHFVPEPFSDFSRRSLYQGMLSLMNQTFPLLRRSLKTLQETAQSDAQKVVEREATVRRRFQACHAGALLQTGAE
jgi:maltose alpha-D-glucosyltransferase / alpha-amylase